MLKKYNIVKQRCGFWGDSMPDPNFNPDELYIIEYSYGEKYGNGEVYGGYSIVSLRTGSSNAWWDEDKLIFVKEGTEDDLIHAKKIYNERIETFSDLAWIKENFKYGLPGTSILVLFDQIGYDSAFNHNGEYYALWYDWETLYPLFDCIYKSDKDGMYKALTVFKENYRDEFTKRAEMFFKKVNI